MVGVRETEKGNKALLGLDGNVMSELRKGEWMGQV